MAGSRAVLFSAAGAAALLAIAPALAVPGNSAEAPGAPSQTAPAYDAAAEYQRGIELLDAGSFADAEAAFDRVIFATPDNPDARYMKGVALAGQEKLLPARIAFESALHYDENHIAARRDLGVTLAKMGNTVRAEEELATLRARAESCAGTCAEAADITAAVDAVAAALGGDQAALATDVQLALLDAAEGDLAYVGAVSLINEGRYEDAIAALRQAQAAFGPHPDILTYLGYANRKLHRYEDAERYYYAALAAAPEHRGATEYLGELRVEQGDLAEAERLLGRLETLCAFGCAEADELRRWIDGAK